MQDGRAFTVTYSETMVRDAVRTLVWKRTTIGQKLLWLVEFGLIILLFVSPRYDWTTAVVAFFVCLAPALVVLAWIVNYRNTMGKFRRMQPPRATVAFEDDGVRLDSNLGSALLPWPTLIERCERPGYWMLFLARYQFVTLPVESLPADILALLQSKVPKAI